MRTHWFIEQRDGESWAALSRQFGTWLLSNASPDEIKDFGWSEADSLSLPKHGLCLAGFVFSAHHGAKRIEIFQTWAQTTDRVCAYWQEGMVHFLSGSLVPVPHLLPEGIPVPPWLK